MAAIMRTWRKQRSIVRSLQPCVVSIPLGTYLFTLDSPAADSLASCNNTLVKYGIEHLTLYRPYLYSYPIRIALFETRLTSPLGQ